MLIYANPIESPIVSKAVHDAQTIFKRLTGKKLTVKIENKILPKFLGLAYPGRIELDFDAYENNEVLDDTIRHELCHVMQYELYPNSLDHGREWRSLAKEMKCESKS